MAVVSSSAPPENATEAPDEVTAPAPDRPPEPTLPGLPNGTNLLGTLLLTVADAMLLAALLATWWTIKGGTPAWPPRGVNVNTYIPSVVTITVAMSAFSVQWAVSAIRRNDQRNGTIALILSVFLGIAIANAQWYSITRVGFGIRSHAYGTLYYLLIGYHLVHMVMAVIALVLVGSRALVGHFGRHGYDPLRAAAAFWQYTNVAWFAIMTAVFLFSAHA